MLKAGMAPTDSFRSRGDARHPRLPDEDIVKFYATMQKIIGTGVKSCRPRHPPGFARFQP